MDNKYIDEGTEVILALGIDDYGLDYCMDITDMVGTEAMHEAFVKQLADQEDCNEARFRRVHTYLSLRSRMNSQRNYTGYILKTSYLCSEALIKQLGDNNKVFKDLVKEKGIKIP